MRLEPSKRRPPWRSASPKAPWGREDTLRQRKRMVTTLTPARRLMQIVDTFKYLGVQLGPTTAGEDRWKEVLERFNTRTSATAKAGVVGSIGLRHLRTYAIPVLSYVAQFSKPTATVLAKTHSATEGVLHMPHRSLLTATIARLRVMNIPAPWPDDIELRATRAAVAASHRRHVGAAVVALRNARGRWAPLAALANEDMHHGRRLWQAPSIAEVAAAALGDFDAAMQGGHEADDRARAKIRRHFGCEPDPGACASSLVPRLQVRRCGSQRYRRPCSAAFYWRLYTR